MGDIACLPASYPRNVYEITSRYVRRPAGALLRFPSLIWNGQTALLPCRARPRLHAQTVPQARSMLLEFPATPSRIASRQTCPNREVISYTFLNAASRRGRREGCIGHSSLG